MARRACHEDSEAHQRETVQSCAPGSQLQLMFLTRALGMARASLLGSRVADHGIDQTGKALRELLRDEPVVWSRPLARKV